MSGCAYNTEKEIWFFFNGMFFLSHVIKNSNLDIIKQKLEILILCFSLTYNLYVFKKYNN